MSSGRAPHPIPYQGSKRRLAGAILSHVGERRFERLHEPFAGSAAITIAAARAEIAQEFAIADTLQPLIELWRGILSDAEAVAGEYEAIWTDQLADPAAHFLQVRDRFNREGGAARLLYLLARCVKNSPRFNARGAFNQSADHRRTGMNPSKMRRELLGVASLLAGRTTATCADFEDALRAATPQDLVYLDPPWEGTSKGADKRYRDWLSRERLIEVLEDLDRRAVPYMLSYDGRHGDKTYGAPLPDSIDAVRLELDAGRSSQATLHGKAVTTYESLYLSRTIACESRPQDRLPLLAA